MMDSRYRIKAILDGIFAVQTPVRDINIIKVDEHDRIIFAAKIYDAGCDAEIMLARNADGSYAARVE